MSRSHYRPGKRFAWDAGYSNPLAVRGPREHLAIDLDQGLAEWADDHGGATCHVLAHWDMLWRHHRGRRRSRRVRTQARMAASFARNNAWIKFQLLQLSGRSVSFEVVFKDPPV